MDISEEARVYVHQDKYGNIHKYPKRIQSASYSGIRKEERPC